MGTTSDNEKVKALLRKFRAGQCTPEEEARVRQWFDALAGDAPPPDPVLAEQAAYDIRARVMQAVKQDILTRRQLRLRYLRHAVAAAAVVTGLLAFTYFLFLSRTPVTYTQVATAPGEQRTVALPDGSTVLLNAGSVLRIPSDYDKEKREIWLEGEGFFSVRRHSGHPFTVRSGELYTEVLGTEFNVKAYTNESAIQVAVTSGKVRVSRREPATAVLAELSRDRILEYNTTNNGYMVRNGEADRLAAWRHNILSFEEASLPEIARALERRYNVKVQVTGNTSAHCIYTIQFKDPQLDKVLEVLSGLSGMSYRIQGRNIIIDIKNCN